MKASLAKILHDLRTPLTVLQGFLYFTEKKELGKEGREYWQSAMASLEKLKAAIEDLKNWPPP